MQVRFLPRLPKVFLNAILQVPYLTAVGDSARDYLKRFENKVSIELLDSLATLSINLVKAELPVEKPEPVMWYGYYAE